MKNKGEIYALDLNRKKLGQLEEMCGRLGIKIIKAIKADAAISLPIPKEMKFDRVLADAPCSGFGTLRKNPDLKWKKGIDDIRRLAELQTTILRNLSSYVKIAGVLVYSTCTVFGEENENVIGRFLDEHPEFHLGQVSKILPEKCHIFVRNGYFKTFPPKDEMDGFFVARLVKVMRK